MKVVQIQKKFISQSTFKVDLKSQGYYKSIFVKGFINIMTEAKCISRNKIF